MPNPLLQNLHLVHTTALGLERIGKNLSLSPHLQGEELVSYCKAQIKGAQQILRRGKNWYASTPQAIFTVNAHSFTLITAHPVKGKLL